MTPSCSASNAWTRIRLILIDPDPSIRSIQMVSTKQGRLSTHSRTGDGLKALFTLLFVNRGEQNCMRVSFYYGGKKLFTSRCQRNRVFLKMRLAVGSTQMFLKSFLESENAAWQHARHNRIDAANVIGFLICFRQKILGCRRNLPYIRSI